MIGLKQTIEKYFVDNWVNTDVFFFGVEADTKNATHDYIFVRVTPLGYDELCVNGEDVKESMTVEVFCYSSIYNNALQIGDTVLRFLRNIPQVTFNVGATFDTTGTQTGKVIHAVNGVAYTFGVIDPL